MAIWIALFALITAATLVQQLNGLTCEKAGCQYCFYSKMQQHCAGFCSSCSGSVPGRTNSYKIVPYGPSTHEREVIKYTRPYDRKPYANKPITSRPNMNSKPRTITKPTMVATRPPIPTTTRKYCDGINPCIPLEDANARFQQCCEDRRMKSACIGFCRYDITREEARFAFMHGKCPFRQLQTYLSCAAQGKDRRDCCEKMGVLGGHRAFCEPFCNPDDPSFPGAKPRYQPCAEKLTSLMTCFWAGLE